MKKGNPQSDNKKCRHSNPLHIPDSCSEYEGETEMGNANHIYSKSLWSDNSSNSDPSFLSDCNNEPHNLLCQDFVVSTFDNPEHGGTPLGDMPEKP